MVNFRRFWLCLGLFSLLPSLAYSSDPSYVGAEKCLPCHEKEHEEWRASGHANILQKASDPSLKNIPLPDGTRRRHISYVIGGFRWKALFLHHDGYLITSAYSASGKNQYNLRSNKWVDYLPGQRIPYDCGGCHTTGYIPEGHQNGLKGIIGTWKFNGVQCEECHGPGSIHADSALKGDIKTDKNNCSRCHGIRPLEVIPVNGIFLAPYTEANQLQKSTMRDLSCLDCHNPHRSSLKSIIRSCESCHPKEAAEYRESYMYRKGVRCTDCHMPPAGKVAEGSGKAFQGDLKSHIFKIDHLKEFPLMTKNGQQSNPGYLSVEYACLRCHHQHETRLWAVSFGAIAHKIKITANIRIIRLQMVLAFLGFLSALAALLSGFVLKKWFWLSANKKKMLSLHRYAAWITASLYGFITILCLYFHFPWEHPSTSLDTGWFFIHFLIGPLGLVLYGGKITIVKKLKKGWGSQGLWWGTGLFAFWVIQYGTSMLLYFNILKS